LNASIPFSLSLFLWCIFKNKWHSKSRKSKSRGGNVDMSDVALARLLEDGVHDLSLGSRDAPETREGADGHGEEAAHDSEEMLAGEVPEDELIEREGRGEEIAHLPGDVGEGEGL
jgi:hypothetical protein